MFGLYGGLLFAADQIVVGKRYTQEELGLLSELEVYAKISINKRNLIIYKKKTRRDDLAEFLNIERIILLEDDKGNYLDGYGLFLHWSIEACSLVTSQACVAQVRFDEKPVTCLLYIDEFSEKITFFPAEHRYIGDVCLSNGQIYYSVEAGGDSIWRIDIASGLEFYFSGYFPNVDLYEIIDDGEKFIVFSDQDKQYILKGDIIIPASKRYVLINDRKRLRDFLIQN
jgi:hypothetical protein